MTITKSSIYRTRTGVEPAHPEVMTSDDGVSFSFELNTENGALEIALLKDEEPDMFGGPALTLPLNDSPCKVSLDAMRFADEHRLDRAEMLATCSRLMMEGVIPKASAMVRTRKPTSVEAYIKPQDRDLIAQADDARLRGIKGLGDGAVAIFNYMVNLEQALERDGGNASAVVDYAIQNDKPEFMDTVLSISTSSGLASGAHSAR